MPKDSPHRDENMRISDEARQRAQQFKKAKKEYEDAHPVDKPVLSRWDRFTATITNKEVKGVIKNVGKVTKAGGDGASKTFAETSTLAGNISKGTTTFGATTQFFETYVDVRAYIDKFKAADKNLDTLKKRAEQRQKEDDLAKEVAQKMIVNRDARVGLLVAQRAAAVGQSELDTRTQNLKAKQEEVASLERRIKFLEQASAPGRVDTTGMTFLQEEQQRITQRISRSEFTIERLEKETQNAKVLAGQELEKLERQREVLEDNLALHPDGEEASLKKVQLQETIKQADKYRKLMSGMESDNNEKIAKERENIQRAQGQLRFTESQMQRTPQDRGIGNDFLKEQHKELTDRLAVVKGEVDVAQKSVVDQQARVVDLNKDVTDKQDLYDVAKQDLSDTRQKLLTSLGTNKLKQRNAEKELDTFFNDFNHETAKVGKSVMDGLNSTGAIVNIAVSTASHVVQEGAKLGGGLIGAIAGPVTFGVNLKDTINDVDGNLKALKLKQKAHDAIKGGGIDKNDAELLAIAERVRLKQKKTSVEKGLSATKNAFGALGGLGTAASGTVAIMSIVGAGVAGVTAAAAVLTPVGWGLAGAAAVAAIGYGCYKLARHLNSQAIKEALRTTIQLTDGEQDKNMKLSDLREKLKNKIETGAPTPEQLDKLANGTRDEKKQAEKEIAQQKKDAQKQLKALDKVAKKAFKAKQEQHEGEDLSKGDLTVEELQNYSNKKLLSRDTNTATQALYTRFKQEFAEHLNGREATQKLMDEYMEKELQKGVANSAVSLMGQLGVALKNDEALDLYREVNPSEGQKYLNKKIYSAGQSSKVQQDQQVKPHSVRDDLHPSHETHPSHLSQSQSQGKGVDQVVLGNGNSQHPPSTRDMLSRSGSRTDLSSSQSQSHSEQEKEKPKTKLGNNSPSSDEDSEQSVGVEKDKSLTSGKKLGESQSDSESLDESQSHGSKVGNGKLRDSFQRQRQDSSGGSPKVGVKSTQTKH